MSALWYGSGGPDCQLSKTTYPIDSAGTRGRTPDGANRYHSQDEEAGEW